MLDNFGEYNFCEAALSGYYSRTIVDKKQNTIKSPASILAELRAKGLGTNKLDNCFRGLHRFKQDLIAHVDSGNPINSYTGKYLSDFIPFDTDNHNGAHFAVPEFRQLLEALDAKGLKVTEAERYSYSATGLKGFVFLIHAGAIGFEPEHDFAQIARQFAKLLLPGKVGRFKAGVEEKWWIDSANFETARLYRVIGSFNAPKSDDEAEKTKEKIRGYKVELSWNEIETIVKNPEQVYELWKAPNLRGIDDATILGDRYWKCQPVPFLQNLWQQAKETYKEEKVQIIGTSFTPSKISTRHPACVAKLLDVIQNGDVDNLLAGHRHQAFLGLSTYAANGLGLSVSPQAHATFVTEIHNRLPSVKQLPEHELKEIIRDGLKFSFSCGNADSGTSLIKFCSASCVKKPDANRRWETPLELYPKVRKYFDVVNSPLKIGLKRIDDYMCGLDRLGIYLFLADTSVGKTMIGLQSFIKLAKIAKELDVVVVYCTPEEQLSALMANVAVQTEKRSKRLIDRMMVDMGMPDFRSWCEEYENHVRFVDAKILTCKGIEKELQEIKQTTGKDLPVFYLDNLTFVRMAAAYLQKGSNYAQQVADELEELVYKANAAVVGTIHQPKDANRKIRKTKDGRTYAQSVPELYGGMGSSFWANKASGQWGLSRRDRFMMVNWTKGRKDMDGEYTPPKSFPLYVTNYYRALELHEVEAMPEEERRKLPNLDMMEFRALDEGIDPLSNDDEKPRRKKADDKRNVLEFAND